jgi:hypothetical protein
MRFQVPQYIDIEDKIFGPFTFKQFVYMAGGAGLSFIAYYFLPSFFIAMIFILPIMMFSGLLAFYQHNNKPFVFLLESFFYYFFGDKLFIWKKDNKKPTQNKESEAAKKSETDSDPTPGITRSNLHNLSWKLDMKEKEEKISDRL